MNKMILVLVIGVFGLTVLWMRRSGPPQQQQRSRTLNMSDVSEEGVSHNHSIKKRMMIKPETVPHVVYMSRSLFQPGDSAPGHSHDDMHEVFYIESGVATFTINGVPNILRKGNTIHVAPLEVHEITNTGDTELVLVYYGIKT